MTVQLLPGSPDFHRPRASRDASWLAAAADAGSVGFWRLDIESGVIDCTPRCKSNLGLPNSAPVMIDDIWSAMHPDDREGVGMRFRQAVETRGSYEANYRAIHADGSIHWITSNGAYLDLDERPTMVGTTTDATERRRLENLNELITTNVAEGLCFMDASGCVTYMNPAAEKILGWHIDEIRGRNLHETAHYLRSDGSPYAFGDCPLTQTLTTGARLVDDEELWTHKDGHFVPIVCSSTPIVESGRITGAVISLHDITERKQMENALRDASRAKDEFLATVSHELRTPMTAILGWAGLMKTLPLTDELQFAVQQIELSAKAQAAIVDDLIDVSRAITGKLHLHVQIIDTVAVLNEILGMVAATANAKRIPLRQHVDCDDAMISADRGRLHQVLWNLLSNAIKFTPEGGSVDVRLIGADDRLIVEVADSGIGIAPDFLPFVFDRFRQQASATSRHHGGLGLGLSIVKQLVEMHGGTVSAASEGPGLGTTMTVILPRR